MNVIYSNSSSTASVFNSVFSGNSGSGSDAAGGISVRETINESNNLFYNNTGGNAYGFTPSGTDVTGQDPKLLPLGNYGGPTQTMLPQPGSAAICAGSASAVPSGITTDQRGFPLDTSCVDAGAVQTNYLTVTTKADSGTGSLRDAIDAANSAGDGDIDFASSLNGQTITLSSALPGLSGQENIIGPGANLLTVSGGGATNVFTVDSGSQATLYGLTIAKGISNNGGGISNQGTLTVTNSTVSGNSAPRGDGGGIVNDGTLTVTNSTVSGNSASLGGFGGGIANDGTLTIENSTVSGNAASSGVIGGGGGINNQGTLTVANSTVSGNSAEVGGGIFNGGTLNLADSIVAGNTASDLDGNNYNNKGGNLVGTSGINLAPLGNYGGSTQTMPPLGGSPALNAGAYQAGEPTTDQRGAPRPSTVGAKIDVGSVQVSGNVPMIGTVTPNQGPTAGGTSVTITGTGLAVTALHFGSNPATFTVISATTITATSPAAGPGVVDITATNAAGTSVPSNNDHFTYFLPVSISPSGTTLPPGTAGAVYSQTFTASGGIAPYSFSVSAGSLPPHLSISGSGLLSGTPTAAGTFSFSVTVTDSDTPANKATGSYSVVVNAAVTATQAIASTTLTVNHVATAFTPVTGGGGTGTLTYSVSPSLPAGLSMNFATGSITGTPTATSLAATYTVTVTDADGATATASFSLTVNATVTATQAIASTTLTVNHVATAFTPVTGSGGTTPLTYSVSPMLPAGLSMNSATSSITGTPTAASPVATYTVTVTDANGATATASFSLTVNPPVSATVAISSASLTQNQAVIAFTPVTGAGGTGTLTYRVSPALPAGLSFSTSTGAIMGTPTVTSPSTSHTVTVTDANGATATASFSLTVKPAVTATVAIPSEVLTFDQPSVSFAPVTGSGGVPLLTYSVSPGLPAGLSFSPSTGTITGTPTATSPTATYTVTVTDANGETATAIFSLAVNKATPSLTWATPASIPYGTALSGTQLDATATTYNNAGLAGMFTYSPAAGTVLNAGANQTLSATFVPSNTTDYNTPAAVTTSITITQATLKATANNATRAYGTANPAFSGTVTGAVNGNTFAESFATAATLTSNAGPYAIVPSVTGTNLNDYTVDATDGTLKVTQAGTTTTLSASAGSLNPNQSLTLTAQVQSTTIGTPAGNVNFYGGTTLLGTATLSGGSATFTTSMLNAGVTNSLTAAYQGSQNYAGSTSTAGVSVIVAPLDFSLNLQSVPVVVTGGALATFNFSISPTYGVYPSTVTFSASGLPPGATATFTPATIAASGGAQSVGMLIQTVPVAAKSDNPFKRGGAPMVLSCLLLPLLGMRRVRRSRLGRSATLVLVIAAGAVGFASLSGCGSENGFKTQPVQNYTITITATSGNIQHSFNVTLGVRQ